MKRILIIISLALALIGCTKSVDKVDFLATTKSTSTQEVLSSEQALTYLGDEYSEMNTDVWISKEILPPKTVINCLNKQVESPNQESWLIYVNPAPLAFWSHECLLRFVGTTDGKTTDITADFPPPIEMMDVIKRYSYDEGPELPDAQEISPRPSLNYLNREEDTSKWAILLCGGYEAESNPEAFWNDCSRMYNLLVYGFNYPKNQIIVLMTDGTSPGADRRLITGQYVSSPTDLDGDGVTDIDYSLTKPNISEAFEYVGNNCSIDDDVFIYVSAHGNANTYEIALWNPSKYYSSMYFLSPADLISELNNIPTPNINILMDQCHSGAFLIPLYGHCRTLETACKSNENTVFRSIGDYSEFSYHWCNAIESISHYNPSINANTNNDGNISLWEAFNYASTNMIVLSGTVTPQYYERNILAGYNYGLEGELFSLPSLSGPDNIDDNHYGTYYLSNTCPGTSAVNWQFSTYLTQSNATNSYAVAMPTNTNNIALGQTVTATLSLPDRTASITKGNITCWKSGHIFSNSLIVGNVSEAGGRVTLENPYPGVSSYYWDSDVFTPEYQTLYYTDFTLNPGSHISDESYISVSFTDYFGNPVTIIRMLNQ